ncbi:calcium-binding protein [Gemmobacter lanyuensis]|uniref:Calcium-binding protein n=2 Tax=Gemmobacter lanyuensis TaxID=1054497 RepID=A0A918IZR3_9RHOB|nr:calcium-binding protein [Gemmobacter lanyuensis]
MATVTLNEAFGFFQDWPGQLFRADADAAIITRTSTRFVYEFEGPAGEFAGFQVEMTGTGFSYDRGEPVGGTMNRVRVLDPSGNAILTYSNLGSHPISRDFDQFCTSIFGTVGDDGHGITANPYVAASLLTAGNDTVTGSEGEDGQGVIGFDLGDDVYFMRGGDDWITAGMGNDTIDGGDGFDTYALTESNYIMGGIAFRGAIVNLQTGMAQDPWGGTDTLSNIEAVQGSRFSDVLIGQNRDRSNLMGLRGRDTLDGGANTFTLSGDIDEDRRDEVRYDQDARDGGRRGIVVDLETNFDNNSITGTARDGFGNLDTLRDIERVTGTRFNDSFVGSQVRNVFAGGQGVDSYDGQAGFDSINFDRNTGDAGPGVGIVVNFTLTSGQIRNDGYGNIETARNIEGVWGTSMNDWVKGNARVEEFWLGEGRDTMTGGGGSDSFVWEAADELGDGDRITDFQTTGPSADRLAFDTPGITGMTTDLTLVNGTAATVTGVGTFVFNTANDTLFWDSDGAGGAAQVAIVVLVGVNSLTAANFEFWG